MSSDTNPRGEKRTRNGRGMGEGQPGGLRGGKNTEPCETGEGTGFGTGSGKGRGRGRSEK